MTEDPVRPKLLHSLAAASRPSSTAADGKATAAVAVVAPAHPP